MLLLSHLSLISSCVVVFVMFSVLPVLQRCGVGELGQLELVAFIAVCIVSKTKISCKNVNIIIRITMFFPYGNKYIDPGTPKIGLTVPYHVSI